MSDEEKESVEGQPSAGAPAETSENAGKESPERQESSKPNDAAYNWAELRKGRDEDRRKMQELEQKTKEQQEFIQRLQKPNVVEDDEVDKLADDDIITKGHAKKLAAKMAQEIAEKVIKQREASTVDERLQLKYPDFAEVVTRENIELLKQTEPELAESLSYNPDPYKMGIAAYKMMKKAGIISEKTNANREKELAIKNSQKPLSVNAVAQQSPIGKAHAFENGLTKELKAELWREMQQAAKGA